MARAATKMPKRNKRNFRPTKSGAGMTKKGVAAYRRMNPGSKLKTAVTGKVKKGSKRRRDISHFVHVLRSNEEVPQSSKNLTADCVRQEDGGSADMKIQEAIAQESTSRVSLRYEEIQRRLEDGKQR